MEEMLQVAVGQLRTAVGALIDHRSELAGGRLIPLPSLYAQLAEAVVTRQSERLTTSPRSMPPLWTEALDLVAEIDRVAASWCVAEDTPRRLDLVAYRERYTPDDGWLVAERRDVVLGWVRRGTELLDPPRRLEVTAPCPACGQRSVQRASDDGEMVRAPALVVDRAGCACQACGHTWAPEYFVQLARDLGARLPAGVLE